MQEYINHLIERDKAKQPVPDPNPHIQLPPSKLNAKCPVCGWVLIYRIEQFCCSCGQRFVDSQNDKFYDIRNGGHS